MSTVEDDENFIINIGVGDDVRPTTKGRFLQDIWTDTFDSVCMVCSEDFSPPQKSPIRTISISISQEGLDAFPEPDPSTISLRIHNRHLHCIIERQIQYIPVSHAWHERVALAHLSRLSNNEAERLVHTVPIQTLIAAMDNFGLDVELWHDYVSVPQWQRDTQQGLLLQLPAIFSYPQVCLIHLDDFSTDSLQQIFRTASPTTYALSNEERLKEIAIFYNARWHQRMWGALELAHSKKACIVTRNYVVVKEERFMSDSFFFFLDYFRDAIKTIGQQVGKARFMELFFQLRFQELSYIRKENNPSFGEVFNLIAQKECRDYRDKHLAIASFLGLGVHEELCEQFRGRTADEVCEWVWKRTLERGDCGPLLLVQSPTSKLNHPHPKWIAGGRDMNPLMWGLGHLLHPPSITVCASTSEPLRLKLESVGSITHVRFCRPLSDSELEEEFRHTIRDVLSSPGCCTASGFVAAMERIYPPDLEGTTISLPRTLADFVQSNPDFVHILETLLAGFGDQGDKNDTIEQQMTAREIIALLGLSRPCISSIAGFSRMEWVMLKGDMCYMQAVATIRCHTCLQYFPFRVQLLGKPAGLAEVYRVPSLQYADTLRNGVGIVISQNEIIGRMFSGTPACKCRMVVDVDL
jgi:hypothetical protein